MHQEHQSPVALAEATMLSLYAYWSGGQTYVYILWWICARSGYPEQTLNLTDWLIDWSASQLLVNTCAPVRCLIDFLDHMTGGKSRCKFDTSCIYAHEAWGSVFLLFYRRLQYGVACSMCDRVILYCIDRPTSEGRGLCLCHASYLFDTNVIYL